VQEEGGKNPKKAGQYKFNLLLNVVTTQHANQSATVAESVPDMHETTLHQQQRRVRSESAAGTRQRRVNDIKHIVTPAPRLSG